MKRYKVNEIFYSIQGEGCRTGTPAVFVRFSGCNHQCPFCDTQHKAFAEMTAEEIAEEVNRVGDQAGLIVLTGGEPLLQIDRELIEVLRKSHIPAIISIETNGSLLNQPGIKRLLTFGGVNITCSPKTPEDIVEAQIFPYICELKVVYQGQDLEPYEAITALGYYLQPCSCQNTDETIRKVMENPKWRLSLQTQKILNLR